MSESQGTGSTQRLPVMEKTADSRLGQSASAAAYEPVDGAGRGGSRFWSVRRGPACVVALLLLIGGGLFLYDVVAVRAHRSAMPWRRTLAHRLAEQPLDSTWVLVGGGVVAALGVALLVLAVAPGLRGVLTMDPAHTDVRAGLHRHAAARVLRERAMEVSGVQSVHVRLGRDRADVRAVARSRELDDVRADLDRTLTDTVRSLGLRRPPALSVHVRRAGRKG
ncbi:DUF6286 domain-containing protein [Streptomyces sp. CA-106110]|uniref:DUF6286 domain-containing protein n=1 Tax=Streptomyces sp. CA-106110 TaxID=3240044 RepID=UPI003D8D1599